MASPLSLRPLITGMHASRRAALLAGAAVLAASVALALLLPPSYKANETLLVLFGPEYTYRPLAGEQSMVNASLEREQVLRTELSILEQPDVLRAAIARIGIDTLYPELLRQPGRLGTLWRDGGTWLREALRDALHLPSVPPPDAGAQVPEQALRAFTAHLGTQAMKAGNTIEVSFSHADPAVAARVIDTLTQLYLDRRQILITSQQSALVGAQAEELRTRLDAADHALAAFRSAKALGGFETRRAILLQAQGAVEAELQAATRDLAESSARLDAARTALKATAPSVMQEQSSEVDARTAPLRASLDALQAKYADFSARYRSDSPVLADLSQQIATRQQELSRQRQDQAPSTWRMARNPLVTALEADEAKAQTDHGAAAARHATAEDALRGVVAKLAELSSLEQQLDSLERDRAVLNDQYRAAVKLQEDRRITEEVEAHKVPSVRVMQPALPPAMPEPTRRLLLLAGGVLGVLTGLATMLFGHALRRTWLLPEALERDLGVPVLVSVPEAPAMATRLLLA